MRITFDVNVNLNMSRDSEIITILKQLLKLNTTMAQDLDDINAQLDRIETAHTGIKKDLDFIKAKLEAAGTGSLPAADVQAVKARISAIADKFDALDAETDSTETPTEPTEPA